MIRYNNLYNKLVTKVGKKDIFRTAKFEDEEKKYLLTTMKGKMKKLIS